MISPVTLKQDRHAKTRTAWGTAGQQQQSNRTTAHVVRRSKSNSAPDPGRPPPPRERTIRFKLDLVQTRKTPSFPVQYPEKVSRETFSPDRVSRYSFLGIASVQTRILEILFNFAFTVTGVSITYGDISEYHKSEQYLGKRPVQTGYPQKVSGEMFPDIS